ncbi:MAG: NAD(P)/FAD-dependent oxidoreductase [Anaerolineae bacterium]
MPDIIVIGGGPGGTAAATRAAQLGAQVVLVERAEMGGSCVNRNCIPLTAMLGTIELYRRICHAADLGIEVGPASPNVAAMVERKDRIVGEMREGIEALLPTFGIEILAGRAQVLDAHTVDVDGKRLEARRGIILATGARWASAPADVEGILRPDTAVNLNPLPGRVVVWGSGAAEVEFATLYAGLGVRVTMVVDGPYPLPSEDYEIGQRLQTILNTQGVDVLTNTRLTSAKQTDDGVRVTLQGPKGETVVTTDGVLWLGRTANIEGLGLERAGVRLKDGAAAVDDRHQTSVPGIYAVGDVTGPPYYSSLATAGGLVAAENAMGRTRRVDRRFVPRYAFSIPEVAAVGMTEDEATDAGYDVEVTNIALNTNPRAMGLGETEGGIKLVADKQRGRVLGIHIVGHRATEMIAEATLGLQLETLSEDLAWAVRIHPTLTESLSEAARAVRGEALYVPRF